MNGTAEEQLQELSTQRGRFLRWLNVEARLAKAQASLGIIPAAAGECIAAASRVELLDLIWHQALFQDTAHPMVALLRRFQPVSCSIPASTSVWRHGSQ